MKCVIKDKELKDVIESAVNLICDAVSSTLGPSGNNVIINSDEISPFISNDGVTIARAIESEDIKINTVLEIIREASLKTNEEVGDGTTTTLVLLKSLISEGLKEIEMGKDRIILKKELNEALNRITEEIYNLRIEVNEKALVNIASTSANDIKIGRFLTDVFLKMKSKYSIKLEEGKEKTYYEIKKGYNLDVDITRSYFENNDEIILTNAKVLLLKGYLSN